MADITGMQPAGKVLPIWKGDYDNNIHYEQTDIVLYNNSSYIAKQDTIGNPPPESANANDYWQLVAKGIVDADISDATVEFEEAQTLQNIQSGEETKTLFGKIKKWFTHLNDIICRDNNDTKVTRIRADEGVQVSNRANDRHIPVYASDFVAGESGTTGRSLANLSLNDLSTNNYINVLTNINQITSIGFWKIDSIDSNYAQSIGIRTADNLGDFYAIVSNYNGDGSRFNYGNLQLFSPRLGVNHFEIRVWNGAAAARHAITYDTMLNTTEQISANTESFYAAGALAVKAMMADYNNKINQINSNLAGKLNNKGFYTAQGIDGSGISINDMTAPGIYRFYVNPNTDNANYLGWTARTLLICTGDCAGYVHQIFYSNWGHCVFRRNEIQGILTFDYNLPLYHIDAKSEIAELSKRITALEGMIKSNG